MGILDGGAEEPKSKALRYVVSGVALAAVLRDSLHWEGEMVAVNSTNI